MLAKKGPLGKIWLAAHMGEKKVPKVQVVATNIPESIAHIENPSARPRQSQRVARTVAARQPDGEIHEMARWRDCAVPRRHRLALVRRPRPHRHTPPAAD